MAYDSTSERGRKNKMLVVTRSDVPFTNSMVARVYEVVERPQPTSSATNGSSVTNHSRDVTTKTKTTEIINIIVFIVSTAEVCIF